MTRSYISISAFALVASTFGFAEIASAEDSGAAGGRYSQIVLPFETDRKVKVRADSVSNAVIIMFHKTTPEELTALEHYDPTVVRRVIFKDLGPVGTEAKLVLRDSKVRTTVNRFAEPFRIVIDLFDYNYAERIDPTTGLPLVGRGAAPPMDSTMSAPRRGDYVDPRDFAALVPEVHVRSPEDAGNAMGTNAMGTDFGQNPPETKGRRKLLQQNPGQIQDNGEFAEVLKAAPPGRARAWKSYPAYIYPLNLSTYEGRERARKDPKARGKNGALNSAEAMAEYAFKQFTFGHEGRALMAYQQVLHKNPMLFSKDVLHLWAFAELHFGHGNATLADGYYGTLIERHPESPLAKFAMLRRLDNRAISLIRSGNPKEMSGLVRHLDSIRARSGGELAAQIAIRRAYWSPRGISDKPLSQYLPSVSEPVRQGIVGSYLGAEIPMSGFLARSILLKYITNPKNPWQASYGLFANEYFKHYRGRDVEPHYSRLKSDLKLRLLKHFEALAKNNDYTKIVQTYESLPRSLQSIAKEDSVAWYLADSYRRQKSWVRALDFYRRAISGKLPTGQRFTGHLWIASIADSLADNGAGGQGAPRKSELLRVARRADLAMKRIWVELSDKEREVHYAAYSKKLEAIVMSSSRLRTPPEIVLGMWRKTLSSQITTTGEAGNQAALRAGSSPSASSIYVLDQLARRFQESGRQTMKRQTIELIKAIKPETLESDPKALRIWRDQILSLAEEHRNENNFLEAGRLYTFAGLNNPDVDSRAETLYKGGLLLYRAGRRQEAVEAFTAASEDPNNLFYANLSRERLNQLQE